jgi:hypothetical protein
MPLLNGTSSDRRRRCSASCTLCMRADKGTVYVWGDNRRGQLGLVGVVSLDLPKALSRGLVRSQAWSRGREGGIQRQARATRADGAPPARRSLSLSSTTAPPLSMQDGQDDSSNPGFPRGDSKIVQIACGLYHSVALSGMSTDPDLQAGPKPVPTRLCFPSPLDSLCKRRCRAHCGRDCQRRGSSATALHPQPLSRTVRRSTSGVRCSVGDGVCVGR